MNCQATAEELNKGFPEFNFLTFLINRFTWKKQANLFKAFIRLFILEINPQFKLKVIIKSPAKSRAFWFTFHYYTL